MTFDEVLAQVREVLECEGRVAYRILKRRFELSDDDLEDLKADLIDAKRLAVDEDGKVLVWAGKGINGEKDKGINGKSEGEKAKRGKGETGEDAGPFDWAQDRLRTPDTGRSSAERRQLTVMFCDLVGSTALSEQLDPEELREVVQAYQQVSAEVIDRYEGQIAQYLGDGLLVYFGYPTAHEDDAQRAVRVGLEIVEAIRGQESGARRQGKQQPQNFQLSQPLQVRIGIHTGLVVVGEMGGGAKRELLAMGETPNLAARVQGEAAPNTVVLSAATYRLVEGLFEYQDLGPTL